MKSEKNSAKNFCLLLKIKIFIKNTSFSEYEVMSSGFRLRKRKKSRWQNTLKNKFNHKNVNFLVFETVYEKIPTYAGYKIKNKLNMPNKSHCSSFTFRLRSTVQHVKIAF